jgi:uncharacterized Tic20 family protein
MSETNPTPPVVPPPGPATYTGGEPDKDSKTMAMLAHLLGIVSGPLGALIIWMIKKDQQPFVDDQGKEALNFQLTLLIAYVFAIVISFTGILLCISPLISLGTWIVSIVFSIMGGMKANTGVAYRYPVNLRFIK